MVTIKHEVYNYFVTPHPIISDFTINLNGELKSLPWLDTAQSAAQRRSAPTTICQQAKLLEGELNNGEPAIYVKCASVDAGEQEGRDDKDSLAVPSTTHNDAN